MDAIIQTLTGLSESDAQQWKLYAQTCVKPGLEYLVLKLALASGSSNEVDPLQWWKLNSATSALPTGHWLSETSY